MRLAAPILDSTTLESRPWQTNSESLLTVLIPWIEEYNCVGYVHIGVGIWEDVIG